VSYSNRRIVLVAVTALVISLLPATRVLADEIAAHVNSARSGSLPVVTMVDQVASASAAAQAAAGKVFHTDLSGLLGTCDSVGEVVGTGPHIPSVFSAFRTSASHWSIITDPAWTAIGTGQATDTAGTLYVSVVFCQQAGGATPAVSPATPPDPLSVGPKSAEGQAGGVTGAKTGLNGDLAAISARRAEIRTKLDRPPDCTLPDRYAGLERDGETETSARAQYRP
jgi:hypothetical protein